VLSFFSKRLRLQATAPRMRLWFDWLQAIVALPARQVIVSECCNVVLRRMTQFGTHSKCDIQ
jgi:hypothetical protein